MDNVCWSGHFPPCERDIRTGGGQKSISGEKASKGERERERGFLIGLIRGNGQLSIFSSTTEIQLDKRRRREK